MHLSPSSQGIGEAEHRIRFGRFEADLGEGQLRAEGCRVDIQPQPLRLLLYLIRQRRRVVSKEELAEEVFGGRDVSVAALARAVGKARLAVEPDAGVVTVPRVGYRFVAEVDVAGLGAGEGSRYITLAFLPFDDATNDTASAWVQSGLPALVGEILECDRRITLVTMPSVMTAVASVASDTLAQRVARLQQATGAVAVVHARVVQSPAGLQVDFRVFNAGKAVAGSVAESRPAELVVGLAKALGAVLGCTVDCAAAAVALPRDPLAADAYFRGRQALGDQRHQAAQHLFELAHDLEPSHVATSIRLLQRLASSNEDGDEAATGSLAAELIRAAETANDRETLLKVHVSLAYGQLMRHRPEEAAQSLARAMELTDGRQGALFWSDLHRLLAIVAHTRSRHEEAREHLARSRRFALDSGIRERLLWLMQHEAGLVEPHEAAELALKAARGARQLGLLLTLPAACHSASRALASLGRLEEAVSHAAEGFAVAVSVRSRWLADTLAESCAFACRLAGWPAVAARTLADLDAWGGPPHYEHYVAMARGFCHGSRGEWAQAAGFTARALACAPFADLRTSMLPWHAEALMFSGRIDEAQALIDEADPSAQATTEQRVQPLLMRAALAHRRGDAEAALALLGEALALGPAAMWHTWACVDAAWLHAEAGRTTEAGRLIAQIGADVASLPVVMATRARLRHAVGDVKGALALHRRYLAARREPGWNPYFNDLGGEYERQTMDGIRPLLPTPFLPSRSS